MAEIEDIDTDQREIRFFQDVTTCGNELIELACEGVVDKADRIKVITDLDALLVKLQRVKSELEAFESPVDGAGMVVGNHPGNEGIEARAA